MWIVADVAGLNHVLVIHLFQNWFSSFFSGFGLVLETYRIGLVLVLPKRQKNRTGLDFKAINILEQSSVRFLIN